MTEDERWDEIFKEYQKEFGNKKIIIIVIDDATDQISSIENLFPDKYFEFHFAADRDQADKLLTELKEYADFIFADVGLEDPTGETGFIIAKHLCKGKNITIPIIPMSGQENTNFESIDDLEDPQFSLPALRKGENFAIKIEQRVKDLMMDNLNPTEMVSIKIMKHAYKIEGIDLNSEIKNHPTELNNLGIFDVEEKLTYQSLFERWEESSDSDDEKKIDQGQIAKKILDEELRHIKQNKFAID